MDNTLPVRDRQRLGDRDPNPEDFIQRHRTFTKPFGERLPFEELHNQVIGAILRADVIEMTNVRMIQRGNGLGLALHALFQFRRRRKMGGKNFNRDGTIQAGVSGTVNFSHAAGTEHGKDFIRPEFGASRDCHPCAQL